MIFRCTRWVAGLMFLGAISAALLGQSHAASVPMDPPAVAIDVIANPLLP